MIDTPQITQTAARLSPGSRGSRRVPLEVDARSPAGADRGSVTSDTQGEIPMPVTIRRCGY